MLFRGLVDGIRFCHVLGIHHRDLKLENLMLTSRDERTMQLKIADFGLSDLQTLPSQLSATFCGSPLYAAPELMTTGAAPDGYDASKSDVWSCGVILYALLASALPFDADDICALVRLIQQGVPNSPVPESRGPLAAQLVAIMLTVDPKRRPTAGEVLEHGWSKPEQPRNIKSSVTTMSLPRSGGDGGGGGEPAVRPSGEVRAVAPRRRGASAATRFFKEMIQAEKANAGDSMPPPVREEEDAPPAAGAGAAEGSTVDVSDGRGPAPPLYAPNAPPPASGGGENSGERSAGERPKGRAMTRGELGALKAEAAELEAREAAYAAAGVTDPLAEPPAEEEAVAEAPASEEAAVAEAQLSEAEAANSRRGGAPLTKEEWDEIRRERQVERERQSQVTLPSEGPAEGGSQPESPGEQ